jgi:hypothetical protein
VITAAELLCHPTWKEIGDALSNAKRIAQRDRMRARRKRTPESSVLQACLTYLLLHPQVAWIARFNIGAMKVGERFVRFGPKGFPDLHGFAKDGRAIYVECKSKRGELTKPQADFLAMAVKSGAYACVARDVADVEAMMRGVK